MNGLRVCGIAVMSAAVGGCAIPITGPAPGASGSDNGATGPSTGSAQTQTTDDTRGASTDTSATTEVATTNALSTGPGVTTDSGGTTMGVATMGDSTEGSSESTGTPIDCMGLVACEGECIDPDVDPEHCGAAQPCAANPGDACVYSDELCLAGTCEACALVADFEQAADITEWFLQDDWGLYTEAPMSNTDVAVSFALVAGQVFGTDGNRNEPYPGMESEDSIAVAPIMIGQSLRFISWHVDEGGNAVGTDNKTIELFDPVVGDFQTIVDCNTGPNSQLPFCTSRMGPRADDDWDLVIIDTSTFTQGLMGNLRFSYDTVNAFNTWEQGWYIDDLRSGDCGP